MWVMDFLNYFYKIPWLFFFCNFFLNVTTEIRIHLTAGTMLKENKEQPFHSQLKAINLTLKTHILYSLWL